MADRDAGYQETVYTDGGMHWWDSTNETYPNFSRCARYVDGLSAQAIQARRETSALWLGGPTMRLSGVWKDRGYDRILVVRGR